MIDAIGVEAVKFIDDNFAKQGFQGSTFQPWPKRLKKDKGKTRKILVDTAALRRSFKQTNHSTHTVISTDIEYARVHNEGGVITQPQRSYNLSYRHAKGGKLRLTKTSTENQQRRVKEQRTGSIYAHSYKMKKRQFIGESPVLSRACEKAVLKIIIARLPS